MLLCQLGYAWADKMHFGVDDFTNSLGKVTDPNGISCGVR